MSRTRAANYWGILEEAKSMLRFTLGLLFFIITVSGGFAAKALADGSPGPVSYSNGDVATAEKECDAGDVCATINKSNGEQIKVLIGASGHCNPYVMTFMRYQKDQLLGVWATPTDRNPDTSGMMGAKCGGFRNTHMTIDSAIDMGIFQNTDGKVFVLFFGGTPAPGTNAAAQ
ncbi:MAG: hypothetical protein JO195_05500 [Candidatus Eremiobacteraeota bacterium]|nr:hypothetical protein [Candidatus Eremiobacteraeota bacterium]